VAYWHTFCGTGGDPFGPGTQIFPWDEPSDVMEANKERMDAAFEFITKMGAPFYCFHDTDVVGDGSVFEIESRLAKMVEYAKEKQAASGVKLLWGTANVFSNPRYMNGASTNPDFNVVANAAVQVKNAIDATIALGGTGYVFWGGREGYNSLLNTNTKKNSTTWANSFAWHATMHAHKVSKVLSLSNQNQWNHQNTSTMLTYKLYWAS
jgi:xylose isomerase